MVAWYEIMDVRPRKDASDICCVIMWDVAVPVGFPLLEVIIASTVCQLKMLGCQVPHESNCVRADATANRTRYTDCDAALRRAVDQDALQLQI